MDTCTEDLLTRSVRLARRDLAPGEVVALPVRSGSMYPWLVPGSTVFVKQATWRSCRVGDVIVFVDSDRLTAHRLLLACRWGGRWRLLEKGDQNDTGRWIDADRVLGIAVGARGPEGGRWDFRGGQAARRARSCARKHLVRHVWARILAIPRRVKAWLVAHDANAGS